MSFHPPPGAVALPGLTKLHNEGLPTADSIKPSSTEDVQKSFASVINPSLPYRTVIPKLVDGLVIVIQGRVTPDAKRFYIDLTSGNGIAFGDDIAFHFNPHFTEEEVVVCNSFLNSHWGMEERSKLDDQLKKGEEFECLILVTNDSYKVALCGRHFCEYAHRVRKELVTGLSVGGDVDIQAIFFPNVEQEQHSDGNQRNKQVEKTESPLDAQRNVQADNSNAFSDIFGTSSNLHLRPQDGSSTAAPDSQVLQEVKSYEPYPFDTIPSNYNPEPLVTPEPSAPVDPDQIVQADMSTISPLHIIADCHPHGYFLPAALDSQYSQNIKPYDSYLLDTLGSNYNPLPLPAQQCYADSNVTFPVLKRPTSKEVFPVYLSGNVDSYSSSETLPMPSVNDSNRPVGGEFPNAVFGMPMATGYGIYPFPYPLMQPPRNLMHFNGGLKIGQMLTVNAVPDHAADWFRLHFKPNEMSDDVLFLLYVNFNDQTLIRNSILNHGIRGLEERDVNFFPFQQGKPFQMKILCELNIFKVAVDDTHMLEFRHRLAPCYITFFKIDGAVRVDAIISN